MAFAKLALRDDDVAAKRKKCRKLGNIPKKALLRILYNYGNVVSESEFDDTDHPAAKSVSNSQLHLVTR